MNDKGPTRIAISLIFVSAAAFAVITILRTPDRPPIKPYTQFLLKAEPILEGECQKLVRAQLGAPETAKITRGFTTTIEATATSTFEGHVESEDRSGALRRHDFLCRYTLEHKEVELIRFE